MSDVLLLSLGTTLGWRVADAVFADELRAAGVDVAVESVRMGAAGRLRRAYPVTDLVEAAAARRALASGIEKHSPRALAISTTTAAMLADPRGLPYAVRLDAPARLNRPGARNAILHRLERRALAGARLVLPLSRAAAAELPDGAAPHVVLPAPVTIPAGAAPVQRERVAVAYTPDVKAKGLDVVCGAWAAAGLDRRAARGVRRRAATRRSPTWSARRRRCPAKSASTARRRRTSSARRCAAAAPTWAAPAGRTTARRRSRRSPTARCWSPSPPAAHSRR